MNLSRFVEISLNLLICFCFQQTNQYQMIILYCNDYFIIDICIYKTMKNWESMKDYSYVGIKMSKAKSLCQGLERCIVGKFGKQNPIYQHLQQKSQSEKQIKNKNNSALADQNQSNARFSPPASMKRVKTLNFVKLNKTTFLKTSRTQQGYKPLGQLKKQNTVSMNKTQSNPNLKDRAFNKFQYFISIVQKFRQAKKKKEQKVDNKMILTTRKLIQKMKVLEQPDPEDEEKIIDIATIDLVTRLQDEQQKNIRKKAIKQRSNKVRELLNPIKFPLKDSQIREVVQKNAIKQKNEVNRAKRMITSLYSYKANMKIAHKRKIIEQRTAHFNKIISQPPHD